MTGLFRFWQKDEPVKVFDAEKLKQFVPQPTPVLPPVAYVHQRLEAQRTRNLAIMGGLEKQIAELTEELRQRKAIDVALKTAVDNLSEDPAASKIPTTSDGLIIVDEHGVPWGQVLANAEAAANGG